MASIRQWLIVIASAIPLMVLAVEPERLGTLSNYPLGSGDKIKIQVYGEEGLSMETRLTDAGTILYPFLGEVRVAGMTVGQLADRLVIAVEVEGRGRDGVPPRGTGKGDRNQRVERARRAEFHGAVDEG